MKTEQVKTAEYTLRAMAKNPTAGHSWDALDADACVAAADEIKALRAARPGAQPENIREGDPYDDPAFEALAREHDVWGRASGALCAVFWRVGRAALSPATPAPAAPSELPDGYKLIAVKNFDELVAKLNRAESKGFMPDAMASEWEAFNYYTPDAAAPAQQAAPAAAPTQPELTAIDITRAARVLSTVMEYPWEFMPNDGRDRMRANALAIIDAALSK